MTWLTWLIWLAWLIWALLGWATWQVRAHRSVAIGLGVLVLLYPALAFTRFSEVWFLLSGHASELAFAAVFLVRALVGGFSHSYAERVTYATVAWMLIGKNLWLSFGLMTSPVARDDYASSGSFGLTNDYLRVAEDVVGCSLEAVAAGMGLLSLLVPATTLGWWWLRGRDVSF